MKQKDNGKTSKAPAKPSNKPGPMDDLGRAAKKVGSLVRVPLVREKRTLMSNTKNIKDPSSYVKPGMGPVGKIPASKTMPSKKAAPKKK